MAYHQKELKEILEELQTSSTGLSEEEAKKRLEEFGPNELEEKKKKTPLGIFINQFKDFMILVLMVAAVISGIAGDLTDTIIILVIVVLNAVIGFIQEYRAENAMEALKKMAMIQAHVIRDGKLHNIPSAELVPGDVVKLEAGNAVPADVRLMEVYSLRIDESALTGESVASDKNAATMVEEDIPLGDRHNMAYKSTLVTNGRGLGVVVATGMKTEIGKIASMLQEDEMSTPLQRRMSTFGKYLSIIILGICALLFLSGWLIQGQEPLDMLLVSISLAVAAIPEALPALITITLAQGAGALVRKNALIRKLPAVETLGSVTYICTDKTGTLTMNKMEVVDQHPLEELQIAEDISLLDLAMALNNDVKLSAGGKLVGDPTEVAMVEYFFKKYSPEKYREVRNGFKRIKEIPFDSDRKLMTTVHRYDGKYLVLTKGATEAVMNRLMEGENKEGLTEGSEKMAKEGIRVLAYSYRLLEQLPENFSGEEVEKELKIIGITGLIDPPREEVKEAVKHCKTAGIHVVMITGDHPSTAAAIAKEIGILSEEKEKVVTGVQLEKMSEEEFEKEVENIRVYARVSPEQKLSIVKALQKKKHYVSMTGDGVNDAPSLKRADIGIAMGINGTDVSKESSDMILLDDNFATIVKAVSEGRRIYDNIRKFVKYIMTCNSAEILTIVSAPLLGMPIPLLPIHILWINLVTDGVPGLALAREQAEKDVMDRPPRPTNESFFSRGVGVHIIWAGIFMAAVTLGVQYWAIHFAGKEEGVWRTMVFFVLSVAQLGHIMGIKSEKELLIKQGIFSNFPLFLAVFGTLLLQIAIVYLPIANEIFKTTPLSMEELAISLCAGSLVFFAVEIEKLIRNRH